MSVRQNCLFDKITIQKIDHSTNRLLDHWTIRQSTSYDFFFLFNQAAHFWVKKVAVNPSEARVGEIGVSDEQKQKK